MTNKTISKLGGIQFLKTDVKKFTDKSLPTLLKKRLNELAIDRSSLGTKPFSRVRFLTWVDDFLLEPFGLKVGLSVLRICLLELKRKSGALL